jgi:hypothetical protein
MAYSEVPLNPMTITAALIVGSAMTRLAAWLPACGSRYSVLSVRIGSIEAALRAGMNPAVAAQIPSTNAAPTTAPVSSGFTSYSRLPRNRVRPVPRQNAILGRS